MPTSPNLKQSATLKKTLENKTMSPNYTHREALKKHSAGVRLKLLKSNTAKNFVKNASWGVLGNGMGRVLNLLAMILLARTLGLVQFGYFGLIQSTLGMLGVFAGNSIGSTATRFIAQLKRSDPIRTGRILGLVWTLTAGLSLTIVIILVAFAKEIALSLNGSTDQNLISAIMAGAALISTTSLRNIQTAILAGFERFKLIAILKLTEGMLILVAMPALGALYGVSGAIYGMAIASAFTLLLGTAATSREIEKAGAIIDWRGAKNEFKVLVSFSLPSLLASTMGTPIIWVSFIILSRQQHGITETALYNAAYQWHGPLIFVPMILSTVGMPTLVQLWTSENTKKYRKFLFILMGTAFIITAIPSSAIIFLREAIMASFGKDFIDGGSTLILLSAAAPFHVASNIGMAALQSMNRAWINLLTVCIWAAIFLSLSKFLVPSLGALGLSTSFFSAYTALAAIRMFAIVSMARKKEANIKTQRHT
ncbi:hypothetical protein B6V75_08430 [Thioclava sp. F1Mire-8]|uniref:oligosaccharide flippase family protein n=1 Tax=Thioclava sp. F1Mire-8 TaxID=1973006 RepID=UPI000B5494EF|nr:oligosaccharide flippase family protein [Thioclava sp. F1Mire-8]OWY06102.1 hypothetical protein B6V75_08430 [Thioclava sp. F1Mire-8]